MKERRPEERIIVQNDAGVEAVLIQYGCYRLAERTMRDPPGQKRWIKERLGEIEMEDGRDVYTSDETIFVIEGDAYREVRREPFG